MVLARAHLADGCDVVVPQLLGRTDFIVELERCAAAVGAEFREVLLGLPADDAVLRFGDRRAALLAAGAAHPEAEIPDEAVTDVLASTIDSLDAVADVRPATIVVDAGGTVTETLGRLRLALSR